MKRMSLCIMILLIMLIAVLTAGCAPWDAAGIAAESGNLPEDAAEGIAEDSEGEDAAPEIVLDEDGFPVYDEAEEIPLAEDAAFVRGDLTDAGFDNAFFGFRFALPEGWKVLPEGAAGLPGQKQDTAESTDADLAAYLKSGGICYAFAASDEHGYNNTFVALERIRTIHVEMMTPEALMLKAAEHLEESFAAAGAELIAAEEGMEEFLGEERPVIRIQARLGDTDIYETQVIVMKGTYAANILAVSYGSDTTGTILAGYLESGSGDGMVPEN